MSRRRTPNANDEPTRTPNAERDENDERTKNDEARTTNVKPVREVLDAGAFVPPEVVALARWTAEYYAAGVGDAIPALLPPMARGARADAHKKLRVAAITPAGLEALDATATITAKQQEALALLAGTPTGIATPALAAAGSQPMRSPASPAVAISASDTTASTATRSLRTGVGHPSDPGAAVGGGRMGVRPLSDPPRQLTGEQAAALERLMRARRRGRVPRRAAARRHRQRQDRDLHPPLGRGPRGRHDAC